MPLEVALVSPESLLYSGQATLAIVRTTNGEIGFQPGHVPFVGTLVPSVTRLFDEDGSTQRIAVHSGFIEVANDQLTLLSDVAELAEDIDVPRAQAALERAEAALAADGDDEEADAAKRRAEARLDAAGSGTTA